MAILDRLMRMFGQMGKPQFAQETMPPEVAEGGDIPQVQMAPAAPIRLQERPQQQDSIADGIAKAGAAIGAGFAQNKQTTAPQNTPLGQAMTPGTQPVELPTPPISTTFTPRPTTPSDINAGQGVPLGGGAATGTVKGGMTDEFGTPTAGLVQPVAPPNTVNPTVAPAASGEGQKQQAETRPRFIAAPTPDKRWAVLHNVGANGQPREPGDVVADFNAGRVQPLEIVDTYQQGVDIADSLAAPVASQEQFQDELTERAAPAPQTLLPREQGGTTPFVAPPTGYMGAPVSSDFAPVEPLPEELPLTPFDQKERIPDTARTGRIKEGQFTTDVVANPDGSLKITTGTPTANGEVPIILPTSNPNKPVIIGLAPNAEKAQEALAAMNAAFKSVGVAGLLQVVENADGTARIVLPGVPGKELTYSTFDTKENADNALANLQSTFASRQANQGVARLAPMDLGTTEDLAAMGTPITPEQAGIDERILELQTQLRTVQNPAQRAAMEAAISVLQERRQGAGAPDRLATQRRDARIEEAQARIGQIATELQNPNLTPDQRETLMAENRTLSKELADLETSREMGVETRETLIEPIAPPAKKNDPEYRMVNGAIVDKDGVGIVDTEGLQKALSSNPQIARDLAVKAIDEQIAESGDPLEIARLRRRRAQAEIAYLENRPRDKKRGWKDFFIGLGLGALQGMAGGRGLGGALGGALTGGIGSLIDPDFEQKLLDIAIRRPRAERALKLAQEAEATETEAQKADLAAQKDIFSLKRDIANEDRAVRDQAIKEMNQALSTDYRWLKWKEGKSLSKEESKDFYEDTGIYIPPNVSLATSQVIAIDAEGTLASWNPKTETLEVLIDPRTGKPVKDPRKAMVAVEQDGQTIYVPPSSYYAQQKIDERAAAGRAERAANRAAKGPEARKDELSPIQKRKAQADIAGWRSEVAALKRQQSAMKGNRSRVPRKLEKDYNSLSRKIANLEGKIAGKMRYLMGGSDASTEQE